MIYLKSQKTTHHVHPACPPSLPFENLRVLRIVEGLMALSKTLSMVEWLGTGGRETRVYFLQKARMGHSDRIYGIGNINTK